MIVSALLALALTAEPNTVAPVTVTTTPPTKSEASKDDERIICRREEVVGSHRPQKTCMTKREWRLNEEQSRNALKNGGIQAVDAPGAARPGRRQ